MGFPAGHARRRTRPPFVSDSRFRAMPVKGLQRALPLTLVARYFSRRHATHHTLRESSRSRGSLWILLSSSGPSPVYRSQVANRRPRFIRNAWLLIVSHISPKLTASGLPGPASSAIRSAKGIPPPARFCNGHGQPASPSHDTASPANADMLSHSMREDRTQRYPRSRFRGL
jgi:hypothetical protein